MLNLESKRGVRSCDGITRRDFLRVGTVTTGLSLAELSGLQKLGAAPRSTQKACIQLFLVGGPSQLETWDPKPDAPANIRGPFQPIQTNVPGILISEHFPRMARRADRYAILRSIYHREAPIHETGQQLLQTGRLHRDATEWPHYAAVVNKIQKHDREVPPWVLLPSPIRNTGVSISHGQGSGFLDDRLGPFVPMELREALSSSGVEVAALCPDPGRLTSSHPLAAAIDAVDAHLEASGRDSVANGLDALDEILSPRAKAAFDLAAEPDIIRSRYGWTTFGQSCLLARRLVEHGVRLVTVNMFDTVFNQITWDCHANGSDLSTTLDDYKDTLCPMFDMAYTALLDDLETRGLLADTLVVSMGEFGRTPRLNPNSGRDHWPGVWSILMAGGGVCGGRVIGQSNARAEEPKDRPIHAAEIQATIYRALGIDLRARLSTPDGRMVPLVEANPVIELF
jgi:uncharacterized protein (DUF1501 family)